MSQPPPPDHGNVVDPKVLAERRAARAEGGEELSPEQRLFELERRLGEVAAERDALRAAVEAHERELRAARQREWAEQQQRLEAQGDAAATRELAGSQVAELRERLAETEAEVAVLVAERDRARAALRDARESERVERARRSALEGEHARLRAELERREALSGAAAEAVAEARRELARERAARVDVAGLQRRLTSERQQFVARVAAVEGAVAAVRERLGEAAGVLRERLAVEREGRVAAEERAADLERELERRDEVEAQLRTALDGLHGELEAVRAGDGARSARLATQVEAVLAIAAGLRDGVRRELSAEQEAFAASLAAMQARVAELQAGAEDLEAERAARWVAEAELDAERRRGDADRAARTFAESRLAEVEAELDDLRATSRPSPPDPAALASLREALAHLRTETPTGGDREPSSLGVDLAAAAARLRSTGLEAEAEVVAAAAEPAPREPEAEQLAVEPEPAPEAEPFAVEPEPLAVEPEPEVEPFAVAPEPEPEAEAFAVEPEPDAEPFAVTPEPEAEPFAVEPEPEAEPFAAAPEPAEAEPSVVEPEPEAREPEPFAVEPEPEAEPFAVAPEPVEPARLVVAPAPEPPAVEPVRSVPPPAPAPVGVPLPPRAGVDRSGPWLRDALISLAIDEPDIAELLFLALLPAQAGTVKRPVVYELAVEGGTTHHVAVDADAARIELPGHGVAEGRISGPLTALVPLATGGATRRLAGTHVDGRRSLRRLLKARRAPLGLADLAAAGVAPSPGLLLTVLARTVPPAWTYDRPLSVDIVPEGGDAWRIVASGHGPLVILPTDHDQPAPATLRIASGRLPAVLAGTAQVGDARVDGDLESVQKLLSWLDHAQRGKR
ncbi:MAG TPA: hypothetical protein VGM33_03180 [Baekduia sp.]|jgi:hypothetical protein